MAARIGMYLEMPVAVETCQMMLQCEVDHTLSQQNWPLVLDP